MICPAEHEEQKALFRWATMMSTRHVALLLMYAIPNGGHRDIRVARKLKAEGVKRGVPDICLPVPRGRYGALYIELKRLKGGSVTKSQREWHDALWAAGNRVEVCRGCEEAIWMIERYLAFPVQRDE